MYLCFDLIEAYGVPQKLQIVLHHGLAVIGLSCVFVLRHVTVHLVGKLGVRLHGVVGLLNDVVAGGAHRDQRLGGVSGRLQRAHAAELRGDFVLGGDEHTAAALPVFALTQLYAQRLCAFPRLEIKLFCLRAEGAAGKITYSHQK